MFNSTHHLSTASNNLSAHLTEPDIDMETLTKKSVKTSRGYTYTYYVSPASSGKPTLLLIHGFPDTAEPWEDLATKHLVPAGYGVIIPDCLGYGGTDKPIDPKEYEWKGMQDDLAQILDTENVDKVITTGHDWGSGVAQRFYLYHPERSIGMITLNVAYLNKPPGPTNLDYIQPLVIKQLGYSNYWYWYLFSDPVEGPEICDAHLDSFFDLIHAEPETWKDTMCSKDGAKNFLLEDKKLPVQAYATEKMRKDFIARLSRDGFRAPLCYYRASVEGIHYEAEKDLPADRYVVNVPYLFLGAAKDVVCLTARIEEPKQAGLLPQLTVEEVDAGHWCMLAKPKEVGDIFLKWLGANF
jgi:pimeloyl-ACP methyl ester carboxylesterase